MQNFFQIDYKTIQILFINQKILQEYGNEPFFEDSLKRILKNRKEV